MKKITDLNQYKIDNLPRTLKNICDIGYQIIDKIEDKTNNIDKLIYRDYFERFIFCFDSLRVLILDFNENSYAKDYSIALILRTSLLDLQHVVYLKTYYEDFANNKDSKKNYESELGKLLCSHIKRSFDRIYKDYLSGYIKKNDYEKMINSFRHDYAFLFDNTKPFDTENPTDLLIYKKEISNREIVGRLSNHQDNQNRFYSRAAGLYEVYSKYEHYGIASRRMQRVDVNERITNVLNSLELIIDGAAFSLAFLKTITNIDMEEEIFRKHGGRLKGIAVCKTF